MVDEKTEKPAAQDDAGVSKDKILSGGAKEGSLAIVAEMLGVSSNFMCVADDDRILYVNEAGLELLGYTDKQDLQGKELSVLFPLESKEKTVKDIKKVLSEKSKRSLMSVLACADGKRYGAILAVRALSMFGEGAFVLEARVPDVEAQKKAGGDIESFVLHDALAGLPALPLFEDRLEMAIARATRAAHGKPENAVQLLVTFFVDMDRIKDIDASYGSDAKAYILNTMSSRLVSSFRRVDTIAKGNHDGFLIFLENINSFDDVEMIARRIMGLVKEGINYKDQNLALGCSIGISVFPHGALTVDEMIRQANVALEQVKKKGGNGYAIYKDSDK